MAKGAIIELRKKNKSNRIINIIRNNKEVSRLKIKKLSKYSMSTVLSVVEELLQKKLIIESEAVESKVGRRPTFLEINPDGGYFIGVEFNAEFMYSLALNFSGDVIYSNKIKVINNYDVSEKVIKQLKENIYSVINFISKDKDKIFGIGIGAPGYVDDETGVSIYYPHLKNWNNVEIKSELEKEFNINTYVESNINVMALAYKWLRPDIYGEDFLLVSIRSGIRTSLMLNNQLYKGKNNTAGEIGHVRVASSNRTCFCGMKGCLETEASNEGIRIKLLEGIERSRFRDLYEMVGGDLAKVNISTFVESVKLKHNDTLQLFDEVCEYLGDAISNLVNTLNPSRVIISGEITEIGQPLLNAINEILRKKVIFLNLQDLKIEISSFNDNIGALGAAALVMQKEFEYASRTL